MIGIYAIRNTINGRIYVGQSRVVESRWKAHRSRANQVNSKSYNTKLSRAIRKYGVNNFEFVVLEECTISDLNSKEVYWIKHLNSIEMGYNIAFGGLGGSGFKKLDPNKFNKIVELLSTTTIPQQDIAKMFNVHYNVISKINVGATLIDDSLTYPLRVVESKTLLAKNEVELRKIERLSNLPDRGYLSNLISKLGFCGAGRVLGVSSKVVKGMCNKLELPTTIDHYKPTQSKVKRNAKAINYYVGRINLSNINETLEFDFYEGSKFLQEKANCVDASHVNENIRRVLSGKRKSYLGYNITKC